MAAAGKKFAFMKATEDTNYTDPTYTSNRASARAAGLVVGAYHFAQPSTVAGNGAAQADHFIDVRVAGQRRSAIRSSTSSGATA